MYIAILGRQPALGIAELERVFGGKNVTLVSPQTVCIKSESFEVQRFGGVLKAGKVIMEISGTNWSQVNQKIIQNYINKWSSFEGKITLGISAYDFKIDAREVQKTGIILKRKLKNSGTSLRLIPNSEPALSTATSHHNKLGLSPNKVELIVVRTGDGKFIVAKSTGSQNITAYAGRDQERPKRDAFVGMLPPKLAQIMINLAIGPVSNIDSRTSIPSERLHAGTDKGPGALSVSGCRCPDKTEVRLSSAQSNRKGDQNKMIVLDPFCGTGVILQEALLMGYSTYGTDLSEKMIDYSRENLEWLKTKYHTEFNYRLHEGDAINTKWKQPIDAVVCETYLGQPFSAPPSPAKLEEVKNNCNHIITEFLKNLAPQIKPGTPVCIAIPAWRDKNGRFTHLPLIATIARLGYKPHEFTNISQNDLLYYRENQIVARELLVLTRI